MQERRHKLDYLIDPCSTEYEELLERLDASSKEGKKFYGPTGYYGEYDPYYPLYGLKIDPSIFTNPYG